MRSMIRQKMRDHTREVIRNFALEDRRLKKDGVLPEKQETGQIVKSVFTLIEDPKLDKVYPTPKNPQSERRGRREKRGQTVERPAKEGKTYKGKRSKFGDAFDTPVEDK